MWIKQYIGPSLVAVMAQIREDLGGDAIILQDEKLEDGTVAVMAGLDDDFARQEEETHRYDDNMDFLDEITKILEYHRLPQHLISRIVRGATEIPTRESHLSLAGVFDESLNFSSLSKESGRPLMLVGPLGDGKTATVAKICARQLLRGKRTAVITLDTGKTGGLEQISGFCRRLNTRLDIANSPQELREALSRCVDDEFILLDSFGVNPFIPGEMENVAEFAQSIDCDIALVMAAGGDAYEAAEKTDAFVALQTRYFIPTKLDSTRRFGSILTAAYAGNLALMAAGTSSEITNGLISINPVSLARLLLASTTFAD